MRRWILLAAMLLAFDAAPALAFSAAPGLVDRITLRATFKNETFLSAAGKVDDVNDQTDNHLPWDVPAQAHVVAPDVYFHRTGVMTSTYYDVSLRLTDGRQCEARYVVDDSSCSRTMLRNTGSVRCESASSWSSKTCSIDIKITN